MVTATKPTWRRMTPIDNDKQVNVFLAVVGPDAYKVLKNLFDPENPNTMTSTRLSQLLQTHFEAAPSVTAEKHKFSVDGVIRKKRERVRIRGEAEEVGINEQLWCFSVSSPKR